VTDIRVAIETVVSERAWGSIVRARIEERDHDRHGQTIRVRALARNMLGTPSIGEVWRVNGPIGETQWGLQLDALAAVREVPTGRLIEAFLAANVPGVGTERAARLWNHWGMQIANVLVDDARIAEIAEVIAPDRPAMGPILAAACCRTWRDAVASTRTLVWLANQGFDDVKIARQIIAILGETAIEELTANPYVLVALLSWNKVDKAAQRLLREAGIEAPRCDPRRLIGAVDATIKQAIRNGHTALDHSALSASVAKHLGLVVTSVLVERAISVAESVGAIVSAGEIWRAPGCAAMEEDLTKCLKALMEKDYPRPIELPTHDRLEGALSVMRVSDHAMHPEQQRAVLRVLTRPLAALQGGAGVGKTTALLAVCDLWANAGGAVLGCTISGKAALRLSRATGRLAMTLAR
jgi:exodeoxyribonuclease V alpha subunit